MRLGSAALVRLASPTPKAALQRSVPKDYGANRERRLALREHRPLSERQMAVLAAFDEQILSYIHIARQLGLAPSSASTACYALSARGLLRKTEGGWVRPSPRGDS